MLCPQHILCELPSYRTANHQWSHTENTKGTNLSFIPSRDFFVCWCWSGFAFSTPRPQKQFKKGGGWKGQSAGWSLIHDSAFKVRLQIKLSSFKEQRCHSPAPGHLMSPTSFEGLTHIFLSCQERVMGAKENRGVQRSPHSQISRVFEILLCYKRSWKQQLPKSKHNTFCFCKSTSGSRHPGNVLIYPVSVFNRS